MGRGGKTLIHRPSASTQRRDPSPDPEPVQEPPTAEPVLNRVITPEDAHTIIEMNQYKYTNVPIAVEHMAYLTSNELEKAIKIYREHEAQAQEEADKGGTLETLDSPTAPFSIGSETKAKE